MNVGVTRSVNVVSTAAEYEQALEMRMAGRRRVARLAQHPDGKNTGRVRSYDDSRQFAAAGALYGTPEEISIKLQALRDVGAEYILLNSQRGLASLRRFSQEVLPAFADAPVLQPAC
jgi:alkanesulfonate monooxygenase SsuD/methylene tetrahydromethanopterin reductase-like flavin-dependent oxidoreductase (luciferase family)